MARDCNDLFLVSVSQIICPSANNLFLEDQIIFAEYDSHGLFTTAQIARY
jgi:hypothetical protein